MDISPKDPTPENQGRQTAGTGDDAPALIAADLLSDVLMAAADIAMEAVDAAADAVGNIDIDV